MQMQYSTKSEIKEAIRRVEEAARQLSVRGSALVILVANFMLS